MMNLQPGGRQEYERQQKELQQARIVLMQKFEFMMNTEGWKEFQKYLEGEVKAAENAMERAITGDECLRINTTLQTVKRILSVPLNHVLNTRKELDAEAAGAAAQKP